MANVSTQTHLKDDDEWRMVYGKDRSFTSLSTDYNRTQLFFTSREQAERLLDAVSEMTMTWREWEPDTITLDAEIEELPSCPDCGGVGPGDCPTCHGSGTVVPA